MLAFARAVAHFNSSQDGAAGVDASEYVGQRNAYPQRSTTGDLIGPSGDADQQRLTARYRGTPTFVAIDRNGRVVRTLPGYPIAEELKHWYAVMVGDQDVP